MFPINWILDQHFFQLIFKLPRKINWYFNKVTTQQNSFVIIINYMLQIFKCFSINIYGML